MSAKVDIQSATEVFPSLKDKCAVRLVSRLNEATEQTRVQKESEGFLKELASFFTGESARRQNRINTSVIGVVEQTVDDLSHVMESLAFTSRTLGLVHVELRNVQAHTELIGREVLGIKDRFESLEIRVSERFAQLTTAVEQVDFRVRAAHHLDRIIWRWKGGAFARLPALLRCYSVLEDLWWGDFGLFIQQFPGPDSQQLLSDLRLRIASCLSEDLSVAPGQRVSREMWSLGSFESGQNDLPWVAESVSFLSDWATPETAPYVSLLSGSGPASQDELIVPHLLSAERLGREFTREFFMERVSA